MDMYARLLSAVHILEFVQDFNELDSFMIHIALREAWLYVR